MIQKQVYLQRFTISAGLAASAAVVSIINITENDRNDYAPFNYVRVINPSLQDLGIRLNGSSNQEQPALAGNETESEQQDGLNFTFLSVVNNSGAVTSADVTVLVGKMVEVESL